MENKLWNVLQELKSDQYEWVELSHSLNNSAPFGAAYRKAPWN